MYVHAAHKPAIPRLKQHQLYVCVPNCWIHTWCLHWDLMLCTKEYIQRQGGRDEPYAHTSCLDWAEPLQSHLTYTRIYIRTYTGTHTLHTPHTHTHTHTHYTLRECRFMQSLQPSLMNQITLRHVYSAHSPMTTSPPTQLPTSVYDHPLPHPLQVGVTPI